MRKSLVGHQSDNAAAIESLENRWMLSAAAPQPLRKPTDFLTEQLTAADVESILAAAASQAFRKQIIVITDREGVILGSFAMRKASTDPEVRDRVLGKAIARARTAAFFESTQDAFTTRTARFIVQDHFPHPVQNTPGGPLLGVEFSSVSGTDILPTLSQTLPSGALPLNISGDPGGIPLFKNGIPVGGIGVAGDGIDVAVRQDLIDTIGTADNRRRRYYNGPEEHDLDEQVAMAGAKDFMAPSRIRATQIFLAGLRFPFTFDKPASGQPALTYTQVLADGLGSAIQSPIDSQQISAWPVATVAGVVGQLKNTASSTRKAVDSDDPEAVKLTKADVEGIIADAVKRSISIRAAIREPQGVASRVHITVVDRDGSLLGAFSMGDGTIFSFDTAVQKARTAAFFSDDTHAFSTTAIGFTSQAGFPPGVNGTGPGPLYHLQNELTSAANFKAPLRNGITIFPGGVPLYKDGHLVGAVGVSGDGVEQDDLIAFTGGKRFAPAKSIRSDALPEQKVVTFILKKIGEIADNFTISRKQRIFSQHRIMAGLDGVRLPYVKFPRNPEL